MINKKLGPFLKKKFKESIDDESSELVQFILSKIMDHGPVQEVYDEIFKVLDEETLVFVMKFWRMLIYETEAKSVGL
jgi:RNA-binding protein 25